MNQERESVIVLLDICKHLTNIGFTCQQTSLMCRMLENGSTFSKSLKTADELYLTNRESQMREERMLGAIKDEKPRTEEEIYREQVARGF